jgi:hypothetical protein
MGIYKLEVEKKFGQLQLRLFPQGDKPAEFGPPASDIKQLVEQLDQALERLDIKGGADSVIFRGIEYKKNVDLRETVRFSKF